jgi:molybdopterin/thiamine biosynthesis adenylyltransferase
MQYGSNKMSNEKFILSPYIRVEIEKNEFWYLVGSKQEVLTDNSLKNDLLLFFNFILQPKSLLEIDKYINNISNEKSKIYIQESVKNKNWLISNSYDKKNIFSRHHLFFNYLHLNFSQTQENISKSHITILGCGGIGSNIATVLATMGVQNITLIDDDKIEHTNLSRQYPFTINDIGKYKVDVLTDYIKKRNPSVEILSYKIKIEKEQDLSLIKNTNIIILSADSWNITNIVNAFCIKNNFPFILVGYMADLAIFGPFVIPKQTSCLACNENNSSNIEQIEPLIENINNKFQNPSFGPLNLLSVSLASFEIIKFLTHQLDIMLSLNKKVGINGMTLELLTLELSKNPQCSTCGV